jgi:CBS domain-containing protein
MASQLKDVATSVVAIAEPETTAIILAQLMRKHHVGSVVVVDTRDASHPVGIVTDRDLVLELMAEGLDPAVFTAGDIMSVNPVRVRLDMDALDAVRLMADQRVHRLLVVDEADRLVGIVTMEDVLELLTQGLAKLAAGAVAAREREILERG